MTIAAPWLIAFEGSVGRKTCSKRLSSTIKSQRQKLLGQILPELEKIHNDNRVLASHLWADVWSSELKLTLQRLVHVLPLNDCQPHISRRKRRADLSDLICHSHVPTSLRETEMLSNSHVHPRSETRQIPSLRDKTRGDLLNRFKNTHPSLKLSARTAISCFVTPNPDYRLQQRHVLLQLQ